MNEERNENLQHTPNPSQEGNKNLSPEANQVLAEGKKLWQAYFSATDVRTIRDELKLNRADVGWYQIRKAIQARIAEQDLEGFQNLQGLFKNFEAAYKSLKKNYNQWFMS